MACCRRALARAPASAKRGRPGRCLVLDQGLEEAPGAPFDDVVEVSSYVAGLEHGLTRLAEGFTLCCRLLREIHSRLLERGCSADRLPEEFRRSQNWIAGTRPSNAWFAPPWPTCSSRPSTRFSTATAASAGC